MKKNLLLLLFVTFFSLQSFAVTRTASVSGLWNAPATWGGTVPNANDDVVINTGVTVTINVNPNNIVNVTINGTLQWDATGAGRTWTVTGGFTVNTGGSFVCSAPGTATTHTLNYNGTSLVNNGTFNMVNGTNKCNVVVGGSSTQTISGTTSIAFNKFTLNNTGGKFQILYSGGSFTPTELSPTKLNVGISTADSCVIRQGLLIGCNASNSTINHTFANFKMGSGTTKITSSVSLGGDATITVNTGMILNDATNSNVTMTVNGVFMSPSMSQSNAATAFGMQGPSCFGGASNSTTLNISGNWSMTDIFVFVGSTKLFGGTEPANPVVNVSGNMSWESSETHTIDLPFTGNDFLLRTCFFGLFDSQGAFPQMNLNGGTVASPNTFNVAFLVFDAPVQTSSPLGQTTVAQISESMANWTVGGNWEILNGATLAVHSDNTLAINGSLRVQSGGAIAGSETETDSTGYMPTTGPTLSMGSNGTLYVENIAGMGKGVLADAPNDVAVKNNTADRSWNLGSVSTAGTVDYAASAASQTITDRSYNNLTTSGSGTKTAANAITANGATTIGASTMLADGGFAITCAGAITNNGTHSGSGKIVLGGTTSQSLSGTGSEWGNIQINNAAGAVCNAPVTTSGIVTFTNGILNTSAANKLILTSAASAVGGSASACVYGPMQRTTASTSTFQFATGDAGNYRPISVTPSSGSSTTWVAEYYASAYSNTTSLTLPITSVNSHSYWTCDRTAGSANATLTLQWNTSEALDDLNGLTVAGFDGSSWIDDGSTVVTGTASSGTITSAVTSTFGPFTLGEASLLYTLPISGSPFCPEAAVSVPFSSSGTFSASNVYTAELSDKKGHFDNPTAIGTLISSANSGAISATIPSKPKKGKKYRIRVTSSDPALVADDNGTNLKLNACGKVSNLASSGITSSSATVSFTTVDCAVKYKVQYRVQGNSSWTSQYTTTGSSTITGLVANTTYEWRVQTYCSESGSSKSGQSAIQDFTTAMRLAADQSPEKNGLLIYPNPATANVSISFTADQDATGTLRIMNAVGAVVSEKTFDVSSGVNTQQLSFHSLPSGMYFVEVSFGDQFMIKKIVKD